MTTTTATHFQTFIYKTVNDLAIPLDVHLPSNTTTLTHPQNLPVYLWFHGGGLLQGSRQKLTPHHLRRVNDFPLALISADYRLAPQASLAEILQDVHDCIRFIRQDLSARLPPHTIDPARLVVGGSSAGGYLALLAGLYVTPKPCAIAAIYPITDPLGTFFTTKQTRLPFGKQTVARDAVAQFLNVDAPVQVDSRADEARNDMYFYMLQEANLARLLRIDEGDGDGGEKFRVSRRIAACGLPPTFVVHGDADEAVGVEQADEVVGAMVGVGVEVVYQRLKGENHLFDQREDVEMMEMYEFMRKHV